MLEFLKGNRPSDIKAIRNALVLFIKDQLQKSQGGEGCNINGISLYINCKENEKLFYESAIYIHEEQKFKADEVQKIADDFAIDLPADWTFDFHFVAEFPDNVVRADDIDVALFVATKGRKKNSPKTIAFVKVLVGVTEKEVYHISSLSGKITIGREKRVQTNNGHYRENEIAFIGIVHEANRSVSRQHGHIEWNEEKADFYLFADEGGIPPYNKLKVRSLGGEPLKLQALEIGCKLKDGDQICLGEMAILEFNCKDI